MFEEFSEKYFRHVGTNVNPICSCILKIVLWNGNCGDDISLETIWTLTSK